MAKMIASRVAIKRHADGSSAPLQHLPAHEGKFDASQGTELCEVDPVWRREGRDPARRSVAVVGTLNRAVREPFASVWAVKHGELARADHFRPTAGVFPPDAVYRASGHIPLSGDHDGLAAGRRRLG